MIFSFLQNLMTFFSKKKIDQIFSFHTYFSHLCKISNPKKKKKKDFSWHVYLNVLNHMVTFWKNCILFLCVYDGCNNQFLEKIFSYLVLWWQSQLGWLHMCGGGRENKMSKDECEFFTTKLGWIISPSW
jgi:hypothetical protein